MVATNPGAATDTNGLALAQAILAEFDLPTSLLSVISDAAVKGATPDELIAMLYAQPAFQQRFPAIKARADKGLPPITPADYVNYERTFSEAISQYGVPLPRSGGDFHRMVDTLLENDVSAQELVNDRIGKAWSELQKAPAAVRAAGEAAMGIHGDAALLGQILDPTETAPHVQKLADAALIAGTGNSQYGLHFTAQRAQQLADTDLASHLSDFQKLADLAPIFDQQIGETQNAKITAEGAGAGAIAGEAGASAQLNRAMEERKAELSGSSGEAVTQGGVLGLHRADTGNDR